MLEADARRITRDRAGGAEERCELCGAPGPLEFSHRQARSQGGRWAPSNGIRACRTCHMDLHAHPEYAYRHGLFVPSHQDPVRVAVRMSPWPGTGWYGLTDWGGYVLDPDPDEYTYP